MPSNPDQQTTLGLKTPKEAQLPPAPTTVEGAEESNQDISQYLTKKRMEGGAGNKNLLMIIGVGAAGAVLLIFGMSHNKKPGVIGDQVATAKKIQPAVHKKIGYMPGDQAVAAADDGEKDNVTADQIENTKNTAQDLSTNGNAQRSGGKYIASGERGINGSKYSYGGQGANHNDYGSSDHGRDAGANTGEHKNVFPGGTQQSLNSVPAFVAPPYQQGGATVAPAGLAAGSNDAARAYADEVSKPSLIFAAERDAKSAAHGAVVGSGQSEMISNFGLETGFHVAAHLEASVSTVGGVPAVAVIEYDCMQNGKVVIPAGSRVIGKISGASSTGLVNLTFQEIDMPNGSRTPINAVGLDPYLHQIKGIVTGHHFLQELALGAVTSVGSLAAGFAGSSSSASISQMSLAREQIANNVGNSGDRIIQQLQVTQTLVVTVQSGTQVYVTFVAPIKSTSQQTAESSRTGQ
jgi:type IV secretory pathway VirB10-like protein